ncbi:tyrosine-protein phosphatase [Neisseria animaloris]|uniref:tyrosine-protein phosphatase n=1 Tax=Neisseria animaloris TaxID=326522 RepID=UPI000D307942|nr:tyrosine-protein phosphatase [Neisseria animaloris]
MRITLSILVLTLSCFARAEQLPAGTNTKPLGWATVVKRDANLYRVDHLLFRSEQPVNDDVATIEKLGIKSVVNLRFFDRNNNDTLLANRNIALINSPLLTWRIRPQDIAQTLFLIEQQQKKGPVLVHCYHGADRTGLISGMYRIVYHGWTVDQAKAEMLQGPYGFHSIWKNIESLFSHDTVEQVKILLKALREQSKNN